jgi:cytidylate kinase
MFSPFPRVLSAFHLRSSFPSAALSTIPPGSSSHTDSSSSSSPYSLLESRFHSFISPVSLLTLHDFVTLNPVLTLGGDQLTGKSTLAKRLNTLLNPTAGLLSSSSHSPPVTLHSAGSLFRSTARELGISVAELSRRSLTNPSIDVNIEYSMLKLICQGNSEHSILSSSQSLFTIIEGRQPAVMATYAQRRLGKKNCIRVYLRCSVKEQAIRFLDREIPELKHNSAFKEALSNYFTLTEQAFPSGLFNDLGQVAEAMEKFLSDPAVSSSFQLPMDQFKRICQQFRDNCDRDQADLKRFFHLYGHSQLMDYRNNQLYDLVIDTSLNTPEQTFQQAVQGLKKMGVRVHQSEKLLSNL